MACGDRYRHLIRTKRGYTLENPCGYACIGRDVIDWADVARALVMRVDRAWSSLIASETGAGEAKAPAVPKSPLLMPDLEEFRRQVEELPDFWDLGTMLFRDERAMVNSTLGLLQDGVCLLDRIDAENEAIGGKPPPVPGPPEETESSFWDDLLGAGIMVGIVGVLGVGLYYGIKKKRSRAIGVVDVPS